MLKSNSIYSFKNRNFTFDLIRGFSIIGVLLIHVMSPIVQNNNLYFTSTWYIALFIDTISKISIPLFFMVSGALLLNPGKSNETYATFFSKRFIRVVVPLLFWSLIYFTWRIFYKGESLNLYDIFIGLMTGQVYFHLWFIYAILGLYIFTPFFRKCITLLTKSDLTFLLLIWLSFNIINVVFHFFTGFYFGIKLPMMTDYLGYFLGGYYLFILRAEIKINKEIIGFVAIILYLITVFTIIVMMKNYNYNVPRVINSYLSPNIILISMLIFLYMSLKAGKYENIKPKKRIIIKHLSDNSFGIYLIHVLILEVIRSLSVFKGQYEFIYLSLFFIFTLIISFVLIEIIRNIPLFGKFIV